MSKASPVCVNASLTRRLAGRAPARARGRARRPTLRRRRRRPSRNRGAATPGRSRRSPIRWLRTGAGQPGERRCADRSQQKSFARQSSPPLEKLDRPLMPFRGCPCAERTQVPPPAGLRIGLLRVQAIFAGCELPNHVRLPRLGEQGLYPARECRAMGIGYVWRWRDRCSSITASCVWRSWSAR